MHAMSFLRLCLLVCVFVAFSVKAEQKHSFIFFDLPLEKTVPQACQVYWWNDDITAGFISDVAIAEGAQSMYGVAARPASLKEQILSYGMLCDYQGTLKAVFISGGRTVSERELSRLSAGRKGFVADIQAIRLKRERKSALLRSARSQLLSLIPTEDIIAIRQQRIALSEEIAMLLAEKKVLESALENLDFKKTESDVFFASEKLLQQYLEDTRPKPSSTQKKSK
jgi:hypothetical protein